MLERTVSSFRAEGKSGICAEQAKGRTRVEGEKQNQHAITDEPSLKLKKMCTSCHLLQHCYGDVRRSVRAKGKAL